MTTQIPDKLIYNGETYSLGAELLEPYFKEYPHLKPEAEIFSTDLWRGYIATFEIKGGELFVAEMEMPTDLDWGRKSILTDVFPGSQKFVWYTGLIRIDEGGRFYQEKREAVFEFLEIRAGNLIQKWVMNYDQLQQFKSDQFEYFKMTPAYEKVLALWDKRKKEMTEAEIDKRIEESILLYTREVYVE